MEYGTIERDYGSSRPLTDEGRRQINDTAHVHVNADSRDCDGRYSHEAVIAPMDAYAVMSDYVAQDEDDYAEALLCTMLRLAASWDLPVYGARQITVSSHVDECDRVDIINVSWETDEGYVLHTYEPCMDAGCSRGHISSRDHTAEAAGY